MKAKRVWSTFLTSISLVVLAPPRAVAQSTPTVIKAKTIYTVTNGTLQNGEILIEAGKIKQVGSHVDAPADARQYSAEVVIPGMIDALSFVIINRRGSCGLDVPRRRRKRGRLPARHCRRHVDCGLDDQKAKNGHGFGPRDVRHPETALRSFPPLVAMVKATHSRQRHDLGRG